VGVCAKGGGGGGGGHAYSAKVSARAARPSDERGKATDTRLQSHLNDKQLGRLRAAFESTPREVSRKKDVRRPRPRLT